MNKQDLSGDTYGMLFVVRENGYKNEQFTKP